MLGLLAKVRGPWGSPDLDFSSVDQISDMAQNSPLIQSVLFQSPYSGCSGFSGWEKPVCPIKPTPWRPMASPRSPAPLCCVDGYRPGFRGRNPLKVAQIGLAPIQTRPCPQIPTVPFKECKGPSVAGPVTIIAPTSWSGDEYGTSNFAAGRLG